MVARLRHLHGEMERATVDKLQSLLDELEQSDDEHTDVSVSDESEWTLSAFRHGLLVWENVGEDDEPKHLKGLTRSEILKHFTALVNGDLDAIHALPWSPGYG